MNRTKAAAWEHARVYGWMLTYLKPYGGTFLLLLLCSFLMTLGEMATAQFIRYFLDHILPSERIVLFWTACSVFVLTISLMFAAMAARNLLKRKIQEHASRDMLLSVFGQIRRLGFSYYEQHPAGETLTLLNADTSAVRTIYSEHLPNLIHQTLLIVLPLAWMLTIHPPMTALLLGCYALFVLVGPYVDRKSKQYMEQQTEDRRTLNRKMYENVSALAEVRAYGAEA